jgi:YihY family inner membrane protein
VVSGPGSPEGDEKVDADEHGRPNLVDRTADRLDALQRRHAPTAVVHGVLKKYGEDRGGQLAMLLAYRGFFSVFPLLLAFVNVVGLLLSGNEELADDLIDSTLASVPIIGAEIQKGADSIGGSEVLVALSVLVSIWAGLGLLEMIQEALNTVWGVPVYRRPPWVIRKLRSLPAAVLVGLCLVLSGASAWLLGGDSSGPVQGLGRIVLPFLAGALCYLGLQWLLCRRKVPFVAQMPGAAFVGASWLGLQYLGSWYVDRFVLRSSDTYGVFTIVFGLLSWSYLLGMLYLYGNELSSVLLDRRWPRSMTGRNLTDADLAAQRHLLGREVRVEGTDVAAEVPRLPR